MWFADIGLGVAWAALAGWVLLLTLALALPRFGRTAPAALLGPPTRLPLLVGSGTAAVLFVAQAGVVDTVVDLADVGPLDQAVWSWFVTHRSPVVNGVMIAVSTAGDTAGMAVLALLGAVVLWRARRRADAAVVMAAALGARVLVTGFKYLYDRARPPVAQRLAVETNAGLPSGHALGSMVVLGVLVAVVVVQVRRLALHALAVVAGAAGIVAIGVSRLYLGVHWMTDVLTGWLLGGAWLAMCVTTLVLLRHRRPATVRGDAPAGPATGR